MCLGRYKIVDHWPDKPQYNFQSYLGVSTEWVFRIHAAHVVKICMKTILISGAEEAFQCRIDGLLDLLVF